MNMQNQYIWMTDQENSNMASNTSSKNIAPEGHLDENMLAVFAMMQPVD